MAIYGIKTPHEKFIKYLALESKSFGQFEAYLKRYQIEYTFDGAESRSAYDEIIFDLPDELLKWHSSGNDRAVYPPRDPVMEWGRANSTTKFVEQLIFRMQPIEVSFTEAFTLCGTVFLRRVCETLWLGQFKSEQIMSLCEAMKDYTSIHALDVFFSEFFDTTEMDAYDLDAWVKRIDHNATALTCNKNDVIAKQKALDRPLDGSVIFEYNMEIMFTDKDMLKDVKRRAYSRYMSESSNESYDRQYSPGRMASLAGILTDAIKTQKEEVASISSEAANKVLDLKLKKIHEDGLDSDKLKSEGKMISRSILELDVKN